MDWNTWKKFLWRKHWDETPWWQAWFILAGRTLVVLVEDLEKKEMMERAASLAYSTMLSFIPVLAVTFSMLKGFGVHNQLQPFLLRVFEPLGDKAPVVTDQVVGFVENMQVGVLGAVGLGVLLYTVVTLMQKVEHALNQIWRVEEGRALVQRFIQYLSILLIGPVLVFSALGLTASLSSHSGVQWMVSMQPLGTVVASMGAWTPYFIMIATFTLAYWFLPNTQVEVRAALIGGVVAGVLWQSVGWAFAAFVTGSAQYTAVYSTFAALLLFIYWLYVAWLIFLFGASVAYYAQYPSNITKNHLPIAAIAPRDREIISLLAMYMLARHQYCGEMALRPKSLAGRAGINTQTAEEILSLMERERLLAGAREEEGMFLPARPLDAMTVGEVLRTVRTLPRSSSLSLHCRSVPQVDGVMADRDAWLAGPVGTSSVKSFALQGEDGCEQEAAVFLTKELSDSESLPGDERDGGG